MPQGATAVRNEDLTGAVVEDHTEAAAVHTGAAAAADHTGAAVVDTQEIYINSNVLAALLFQFRA